jgi:hypothetical protein
MRSACLDCYGMNHILYKRGNDFRFKCGGFISVTQSAVMPVPTCENNSSGGNED